MQFRGSSWQATLCRDNAALFAGLAFVVVLALGTGCGEAEAPAPDSGPETVTDSGTLVDSGHSDSALRDGRVTDARSDAVIDSGGIERDAGRDASSPCALPTGTHPDVVCVIDVRGRDPGSGWSDSYSVGNRCYCESTFDHDIGEVLVDTPVGQRTVREVCEAIGRGPGNQPPGEPARPVYNDIQCGNGPPNNAGDEDDCPGRVDIGRGGCGHIGPRWDLSVFL